MTLQITSMDQALGVCDEYLRILETAGLSAAVAGGFLRDADHGIQPKDVDIFIDSPPGFTPLQMAEAAGLYFTRMGHEYEALGDGEDYPEGLTVFESTKHPENEFPINLIFTPPGTVHPRTFDLGLCDISYSIQWGITRKFSYHEDSVNKTITLNKFGDHFEGPEPDEVKKLDRQIDHIKRLVTKYPDHKVQVRAEVFAWGSVDLYERLIEEKLIGDPRTLLPAEGQDTDGDEVRLEDGAEGVDLVGRWVQRVRAMEAIAPGVFDRAQVQPRPGPAPWAGLQAADLR